jgi:septal ring factor EnvC (AmiA/AmiB activator)
MALKPTALTYPRITAACRKSLWLLLFGLLLPLVALQAQSKKELETRRKKLLRDIEQTDKLLRKTSKTREATYNRFVALQQQVSQRSSLVQTVQIEIAAAEESMTRANNVINALNQDVAAMEQEYGRMVRNAFRRKSLHNPLLYIFSAANLNQVFRRWLFLRKYDAFRRQQAEAIRFTRDMLSNRMQTLEQTRIEKENLLGTLTGQKSTLDVELKDKNVLLADLQKDESRLKAQLQQQQAAHEALNKAIEDIIAAEVLKRNAESRKPEARKPAAKPEKEKTSKPKVNAKPEKPAAAAPPVEKTESAASVETDAPSDNTSAAFRNQRGKLPKPVANGFVARGYGKQKHPTIRNLEVTNNGIDIRTEEGEPVHAVHEGVVAGVQYIPGHEYTVILQHGNYYTVYSNIGDTNLKKGQTVHAHDVLGKVSTNPITGAAELHFELWNQKTRMNPAGWLE